MRHSAKGMSETYSEYSSTQLRDFLQRLDFSGPLAGLAEHLGGAEKPGR